MAAQNCLGCVTCPFLGLQYTLLYISRLYTRLWLLKGGLLLLYDARPTVLDMRSAVVG
jgi:hypothetical protein